MVPIHAAYTRDGAVYIRKLPCQVDSSLLETAAVVSLTRPASETARQWRREAAPRKFGFGLEHALLARRRGPAPTAAAVRARGLSNRTRLLQPDTPTGLLFARGLANHGRQSLRPNLAPTCIRCCSPAWSTASTRSASCARCSSRCPWPARVRTTTRCVALASRDRRTLIAMTVFA